MYEVVVEGLLLDYETKAIVAAIKVKPMTAAQKEGAARLFGGWDFYKQRPKGLDEVPASLKLELWNHVKDTKDEDKLGRARAAFNP